MYQIARRHSVSVILVILLTIPTAYWIYSLPTWSFAPFEDGYPVKKPLKSVTGGLLPFELEPLPLGSVKPRGWLRDELVLEAEGLAGHQHDFYEIVKHSPWLGGRQEYSSIHEAYPYWLNGLVPLAYALDDERLKEQVHSTVQYVLDHRYKDGWLGPEEGRSRSFWARFPLCLGLKQLVEANATWEAPIIEALDDFVHLMYDMLADGYKGYLYHIGDNLSAFQFTWGRVRAQDMMITLQWLYSNYAQFDKEVLLGIMRMLHQGSIDWADWYNEEAFIKEDFYRVPDRVLKGNFPYHHGVNIAQGWKAAAVVRRFTHNDSLVDTAKNGVNWTLQYHGAASGTVLADERLVGVSPYSGSELCTAVEAIYSLSYLYQALGDAYYADKAELVAFNAMPTMITEDWWGHQYMAQPNQPWARFTPTPPYSTSHGWAVTFGLEPNYPCCTVNFPQGLPKFLSGSWARVGEHDIAHVLLGPSQLTFEAVQIECNTNYPFGDSLEYTISTETAISLYVRVPEWYDPDNSSIQGAPLSPDGKSMLHRLEIPRGQSTVKYILASLIRAVPRANDTVAVYKGALLFALDIGIDETKTRPKNFRSKQPYPRHSMPAQASDWILTNTSRWNVAIDPDTLKYHDDRPDELPSPIWTAAAPPGYITAKACEIHWPLFKGMPGAIPSERRCVGEVFEAILRPYGSAKLHMAELPTLSLA